MEIVIKGVQGEGKTTLVEKMLKTQKAFFILESQLSEKSWLIELSRKHYDFLVIDDVTELKKLRKFLKQKIFNVRQLYTDAIIEIIIPANIVYIKTV